MSRHEIPTFGGAPDGSLENRRAFVSARIKIHRRKQFWRPLVSHHAPEHTVSTPLTGWIRVRSASGHEYRRVL